MDFPLECEGHCCNNTIEKKEYIFLVIHGFTGKRCIECLNSVITDESEKIKTCY